MSIAFSKRLVTWTIRVSAIAYMILGTGTLFIIFLFGGLCWLLEMTNCIVNCPFFAWLKLWKCPHSEAKQCRGKVSCSYETDLLLSNSSAWLWGKYREAVRCDLASLALMKLYIIWHFIIDVHCRIRRYFSLKELKDERTRSSSPFSRKKHPTQL